MRKILSVTAFLSLFVTSVFGHISSIKHVGKKDLQPQQDFRMEKVNGNVYAFFGRGGNIGVSYGSEGLMTIDTQFANIVPQIKAELKKLGSDTPKFIFNTHWHGDHTGGNELFGQDGMIIAHQNVYDRLKNTTEFRGQARTPTKKVGLPSITYKQGVSVYMNGEEVRAVHFPKGHTDGDSIVMFTGSNVVHLGDTFFVGRFPFVDLASGGSVPGLINNINKMIQMIPADAKIIPGHGPVSTIDDLKDYHAMLVETTLIVRKHMKAGKSLDDIKKAGLGDKYKEAGSGFINTGAWIETIYKSYEMNMKKTP
jgi:glyoxylase-like metal-dependent hydrolase (beta-lactamase superfamily II)